MFTLALAFYPNQKNPARPTGYGVYRVRHCKRLGASAGIKVIDDEGAPLLKLRSRTFFKIGSRVNPLKIALAAA